MKDLRRILLVDDESDFLSVGTSFQRQNGFDVYSSTDGNEVLPIVKMYKPDLTVLDVRLKGHDGRMICRLLKDNSETSMMKIILHSALPEIGMEYAACGADEFILKPYTIGVLLSKINFHLKVTPF